MKTDNQVIGVDLGGTKIGFGLVRANQEKGQQVYTVEHSFLVPTFLNDDEARNGPDCIVSKISQGVLDCDAVASEKGLRTLPPIGVGSPGKIVSGIIAKGTAPYLGQGIDEFNFKEALESKLGRPVYLQNDAISQMVFSVQMLIRVGAISKQDLEDDDRIAYVGPGTGLGGGFAHFKLEKGNLRYKTFTDGHIGDLVIEGKQAEGEMLSGDFIQRSLGISGFELNEQLKLGRHQDFAELLGENLGKIVRALHLGEIQKSREQTLWSDEDIATVKGITLFVLGGSISSKGKLGERIRDRALKHLEAHGLTSVRLIPVPGTSTDAGIVGAAMQVFSREESNI